MQPDIAATMLRAIAFDAPVKKEAELGVAAGGRRCSLIVNRSGLSKKLLEPNWAASPGAPIERAHSAF